MCLFPFVSKINYLDPRYVSDYLFNVWNLICFRRITAAWCQINDVPIEKMFSKTLITKCKECPCVDLCISDTGWQSLGQWKLIRSGSSNNFFRISDLINYVRTFVNVRWLVSNGHTYVPKRNLCTSVWQLLVLEFRIR